MLAAHLRDPCGMYEYKYCTDMGPKFDPDKDPGNIVKHGLSLVEGEGVLNDPLGLTVEMSPLRESPAGSRSG